MTVGELASKAGVNVQTVRYYEHVKLLPPAHRWPGSGYRDFDDDALRRLRFILSVKELGFTLREIKELIDLQILPGESCAEVKQLLETKRDQITQRMAEMKRLRRSLNELIAACGKRRAGSTCPALWAMATRAERTKR